MLLDPCAPKEGICVLVPARRSGVAPPMEMEWVAAADGATVSVRRVTAQGRPVPATAHGSTYEDVGQFARVTPLCCGCPSFCDAVRDDAAYAKFCLLIDERFDGVAVTQHNQAVQRSEERQKLASADLGGSRRFRTTPEGVAAATATATVRAKGCTGAVVVCAACAAKGRTKCSHYKDTCVECTRLKANSLMPLAAKEKQRKAAAAAHALSALEVTGTGQAVELNPHTSPDSKVNLRWLSPRSLEERKQRTREREAERVRQRDYEHRRVIKEQARQLEEKDAIIEGLRGQIAQLRGKEECGEFVELTAEDHALYAKVVNSPGVMAMLRGEGPMIRGTFATNHIAEAFICDQQKYIALDDKRGMRWSVTMLRWCQLLHTRVNAAGWAQLKDVFNLPSESTLRAYRDPSAVDGLNSKAMARLVAKLKVQEEAELRALLKVQMEEMLALAALKQKGGAHPQEEQQLQESHAAQVDELMAQHAWSRTGCVCFDSMTLKKGVWWNRSTGMIEGFEDLEATMADDITIDRMLADTDVEIAQELLVFWFTGFGKDEKHSHPIGHFFVHKSAYFVCCVVLSVYSVCLCVLRLLCALSKLGDHPRVLARHHGVLSAARCAHHLWLLRWRLRQSKVSEGHSHARRWLALPP
eukprot:COSAG01_NODE_967_length_12384_cov_3.880505_5_plen_641_part_00